MKVIISGGGTGGHIFPAIAIANKIKEHNNKADILFVGALGKMEMEKVPNAGYKIEGLWISGIKRKLSADNLLFPFKLLSSLMKSAKIIKKFKPDVVIGVGGFASGPLLYRAAEFGIPTLIQEQNSYPGITNKILSKKVNKICVAYDGMNKFFPESKITKTGNPVREDILSSTINKEEAAKHFDLDINKKTCLIVGGSQGSRTLNTAISAAIAEVVNSDIQLIWQTGPQFLSEAKKVCKDRENIWVDSFINRMDLAYAMADIVVSRAGASTISELCLVAKPCILVPYPYAAEDHQTKNAKALVDNNAAILVTDANASKDLVPELLKLMNDGSMQKNFASNLKSMALPNSSDLILKEIL
ncbi:MAG: undecaprenyldiphospho-muramoylpentapeptide beta-N-acetylglucosaminyltransferase, partial [Bacteroidia bacterium]|nr:undecaprenyldiphospho-muramoylpentapeptide beta-N-acetylglucosaminyltransferase [Bacteroidia bacterium]